MATVILAVAAGALFQAMIGADALANATEAKRVASAAAFQIVQPRRPRLVGDEGAEGTAGELAAQACPVRANHGKLLRMEGRLIVGTGGVN